MGFTLQDSLKIYVFLMNICTLFIAFWAFRKCFNDKVIALAGAILYTGNIDRLCRIYEVSQIGAISGMLFYPLVFAGVYLLLLQEKKQKGSWICLAVGFTGLLQTHLIGFLLVSIFVGLSCLLCLKRLLNKESLLIIGKAIFAWILINLWFLVPFFQNMLGDYKVTSMLAEEISKIDYHSELASFIQDSGSLAGVFFGTKRSIGYSLTIVLLSYIIFIPIRKKISNYIAGDIIAGLAVIGILVSINLFPVIGLAKLSPIILKVFKTIQYEERFLSVVTLLLSSLGCYLLLYFGNQRKYMYCLAGGLIFLVFMQDFAYFNTLSADTFYLEPIDLVNGSGYDAYSWNIGNAEYLPEGTDLEKISNEVFYDSSQLEVSDIKRNYLSFKITVRNESGKEQIISLPVLYYSGYGSADIDNKSKLTTVKGENNRVTIIIPSGYSGTFLMRFHGYWYWSMAAFISLITILIGTGYLCLQRRGKTNVKKA